jgi:hypothetical protein
LSTVLKITGAPLGSCTSLVACVQKRQIHFPMQNLEKIASSTSSVRLSPVTSPSARRASRTSIVQQSMGKSPAALSIAEASARLARCSASACRSLMAHPAPPAKHIHIISCITSGITLLLLLFLLLIVDVMPLLYHLYCHHCYYSNTPVTPFLKRGNSEARHASY